jgi:hypothetical protein
MHCTLYQINSNAVEAAQSTVVYCKYHLLTSDQRWVSIQFNGRWHILAQQKNLCEVRRERAKEDQEYGSQEWGWPLENFKMKTLSWKFYNVPVSKNFFIFWNLLNLSWDHQSVPSERKKKMYKIMSLIYVALVYQGSFLVPGKQPFMRWCF